MLLQVLPGPSVECEPKFRGGADPTSYWERGSAILHRW